jgi:hypothetical protein
MLHTFALNLRQEVDKLMKLIEGDGFGNAFDINAEIEGISMETHSILITIGHFFDRSTSHRVLPFITNIPMLDFPTQKKLLEPILRHASNHQCADCHTRSPTCSDTATQGLHSISESFFAPIARGRIVPSALPSPA